MAGHQLKKLAQSRGKVTRSSALDLVPKHWTVYTLLFSSAFLLLFCFLLFDIRTSPTSLLLHASNQLDALRVQAGERYFQSSSNSSTPELIISPEYRKGRPESSEDAGDEQDDEEQERKSIKKSNDAGDGRTEKMGEKDGWKSKIPIEELVPVEDSDSVDPELSADVNESQKNDADGLVGTEDSAVKVQESPEKGGAGRKPESRKDLKDPVLFARRRSESAAVNISAPVVTGEKIVNGSDELIGMRSNKSRDKEGEAPDVTENSDLEIESPKKVTKFTKPSKKKPSKSSDQDILKEVAGDEKCDYSRGSWVYDESYPLYKPDSCPFVDGGFRCVENGRPSAEFQKYRWQPSGCDIPKFDARKMLERLRGSRLAFVGDSIGRNNWESMLCMLADGVHNKSRIYEINGEPITKHKGFLSFRFEDYNCTVEYYRSPYLVPQGRAPPNSLPIVRSTLKLDQIDWSASKWKDADYLIFNSGHWWSYEKTIRGGNYFQTKNTVMMEMEVGEAFKLAMKTVANWLEENIDPQKTQVFWRSYAPVHFRGGTWKTGGSCVEETQPLMNLTNYQEPWENHMIPEVAQKNKRVPMNFLNVTLLSQHRPDGHSSIWQRVPPSPINHQDCSHWCLPGVPDVWNEIFYATLLANGRGSWGENIE